VAGGATVGGGCTTVGCSVGDSSGATTLVTTVGKVAGVSVAIALELAAVGAVDVATEVVPGAG
jgi:hypothetical protein